jgi:hypothetical protein
MVINRLVTTKQKKFLEKTFNCLGIDIEQFLEVNNISAIKKRNEELEERVKFLEESLKNTNLIISELSKEITNFITDMQNGLFEEGDD